MNQIGAKVIIKNKSTNKVLLVERNLEKYTSHIGQGIWEIPGGRINTGELLEEGLIREAYEETGLDLSTCKFTKISEQVIDRGDVKVTRHTFICTKEIADSEIILSEEHKSYQWVSVEDLLNLTENDLEKFLYQSIHSCEPALLTAV